MGCGRVGGCLCVGVSVVPPDENGHRPGIVSIVDLKAITGPVRDMVGLGLQCVCGGVCGVWACGWVFVCGCVCCPPG